MPDITMCTGMNAQSEVDDDFNGTPGVCPMRDKCYRHTAEPSPYRQSYFVVAPFTMETQVDNFPAMWQCAYFWDNKNA